MQNNATEARQVIIRELRQNDAVRMYEWMTDTAVTEGLHGDYTNVTVEDARRFIDECPENERHFAIANDEDEYMGTVSLRHIDTVNAVAEFAIVVRSDAMSRGYAWHGMVEALDMAFGQMGLETVYWRVRADNQRAVRFFKKHGFNMADDVPKEFLDRHSNESNLLWFTAWHGDDYRNEALSRGEVAGCRILKIRTIPTIEAGELSFFESCKDIDFDIKRIYYISKVPEGRRRGYHAHKKLKQVLFCP
jgi:RimJ/RimL family protein N-acetyltransferase